MGWGNTLQTIASAILGGKMESPFEEVPYGMTPPFIPKRKEYPTPSNGQDWPGPDSERDDWDDSESPQSPMTRRDMMQRTESPLPPQPRDIPRWLTDRSYSAIPEVPRGTTPSEPGPAQQFPTSKRDDADALRFKETLSQSMANLQRLEAIDPKDKEVMSTYGGTKQYAPGTMKKRNGQMVDVGGQIKKDSMLTNIGKGLFMSLQKIAPVMLDKNVDNKTALGYAIGAAASGGIGNAINGTMDEQAQLEQDKERARQRVATAQGAYDTNIKNRQGEANIAWTTARPAIEGTKAKNTADSIASQQYGRATSRLKSLMEAMTKGPLSIHQNGNFMDTLAELAGVESVKIADFDPRTDTIIKAESIHDNTSGETTTVTYSKGGKVATAKVIDEATGKPLVTKSDRAYVADTAAATSITTTGMRITSAEKIAQWDGQIKVTLKNLGIAADKEGMVYDEYVRLKQDLQTMKSIETQFPDDPTSQYNAIVQLALKAAAAGKVAPQP